MPFLYAASISHPATVSCRVYSLPATFWRHFSVHAAPASRTMVADGAYSSSGMPVGFLRDMRYLPRANHRRLPHIADDLFMRFHGCLPYRFLDSPYRIVVDSYPTRVRCCALTTFPWRVQRHVRVDNTRILLLWWFATTTKQHAVHARDNRQPSST